MNFSDRFQPAKKRFPLVSLYLFVCAILLIWDKPALALPTLQLDIGGGTYDLTTETIVSSGDSFTLYALLKPNLKNTLSDTYYISAAVSPMVSDGTDLGSFQFNGSTIDVTGDMVYGVPPLEQILELQGWDSGDLPKHGIYPTYFAEFEFQFSSTNRATGYNTQDDAGQGPIDDPSGGLYYAAFVVDLSDLSPGYSIHFDLYNTKLKNGGDIDVTQFAPFSHDAEARRTEQVPGPSTLLLLGSGLIGLGLWKRNMRGTGK